ncbi:hypothetical protein Dimus_016306 [Dionaea muscipula]
MVNNLAHVGFRLVKNQQRFRSIAIAPTRTVQKLNREEEADEACKKAREAAESMKEGAKEVRETCEYVKDMVASGAKTINKVTKDVAEKVTETTDAIKDKLNKPIQDAVGGLWEKTTLKIEDKVVDKIKDEVIGKSEEQRKGH